MSIQTGQPPKAAGLPTLVRSLLINLLGPYLVYLALAPHFPKDSTTPLLLSGVVPAAEFAIQFARRRMVDAIAIIAFVQIGASLAIALVMDSAHAALGGQAVMPAMLGLVFGASALLGRPLMMPLARQTMAGDDPERQARFDAIALQPVAQRVFLRLTLIWAISLGAESVVLLALLRLLGNANYLLASQALSYGVLGLLIGGSIYFGRRAIRNNTN